jgi:membrane-associated phospholipid phosphatase
MFPFERNEKHMAPAALLTQRQRGWIMSAKSVTPSAYSAARTRHGDDEPLLSFPVLDREPPRAGRRLVALAGSRHPVRTYACGVLVAFVAIATLSILAGLLVTQVLVRSHGIAADDESVVRFLARHRSRDLTDASLVGSIMAGGVVLPIVAGVAALLAAFAKHWRLAGFLLFALAVESGSYRATTLLIHRHRPEVPRLEKLPVNASYPSGHTAAAIAVYCGIALLLTSKVSNVRARIAIWIIAVLIPAFVALSRMYRGMHHPLDIAGGVVVGIAALAAMVTVSRAAHFANSAGRGSR